MHCIGDLGWKLKFLISGNFSHLFNKFLPSIFLFYFVSYFPSHCFFLYFLGDFLHLISYLSLSIYLIIINTILFSIFLNCPWTKYLFLSLGILVIVFLKFSFTLHCLLCFFSLNLQPFLLTSWISWTMSFQHYHLLLCLPFILLG